MVLVNNGLTSRTILTLYGSVTYKRTFLIAQTSQYSNELYNLEGVRGIFPKDCALGIDKLPFKCTYKMIAALAREGVRAKSYKEAARNAKEKYNADISPKQIEKITNYVGCVVWDNQCDEACKAKQSIEAKIDRRTRRRRKNDILYIEIDGAYVHVRDKQEASGTTSGWIESKQAIAFHSSDIHYWEKRNSDGELNNRIDVKDCTGYIGSADEFKYHLFALAKRKDCDHVSEVVFICDGALWIKDIVEKYFPYATYILDLYHAKEHAGNFARYVKSNSSDAKDFANELCNLIDEGNTAYLLEILKPYADVKMPEGITNLYTYIDNHRSGMNYPIFREKGYFVGSGAIESANRYLLQNRMKLPGMRWNINTAQGMLSLKTKEECGNWNAVVNLLYEHFYGTRAS